MAQLLEHAHLSRLRLRNRAVLSPMTRVSAQPDGAVSERIVEYYRIFAAGGFGAVITEGSYIDTAHSQTYLNQPGLATAEHAQSWRRVTDAVHAEGAAIIAQLQHAGPQSQGNPYSDELRSPSAIGAKGEQLAMYRGSGPYRQPVALSADEITQVRQSFVDAALRARDAGFDGVEIHGANGYLLDAFVTDYLNDRADQYGGSPANRIRLACEVIEAVRGAVGQDFVVGVRISQGKVSDPHHKWSGGAAEASSIFGSLARTGVDYIHTTEWVAANPAFENDPRSLAALARQFAPGVTIIANGHIDDEADASSLLAADADFVAIGRSALANRDWPRRVESGHEIASPLSPQIFGDVASIQDWELDANTLLTN